MVTSCVPAEGYVAEGGDCDDDNDGVYPDAADVCDLVDNDCDGDLDEDIDLGWYPDDDGDGFGTEAEAILSCDAITGYADNSLDCDDADPDISPEAEEVCDDIDNDCDGEVDLGAVDMETYYKDLDGERELGTRNLKVALRRLRKFARDGAGEELDLSGTINALMAPETAAIIAMMVTCGLIATILPRRFA